MLTLTHSEAAFKDAQALMPGGVNSPVRSYGRVHCTPPFIASAKGSSITDIDGNTYIDYVGSWGPMIAGHAHPRVVKALQEAAARGTSYGAPTLLESEIARLIKTIYPSIEKLRMVNSGTEATMSALRVARGFTGRDKIIKFQGCYHGHADSLLVSAGSGAATFGRPDSPGVPAATAADTITLPYNDSKSFNRIMDGFGNDIAAVIVEPVAGNMGLVLPEESFLQALRNQTQAHGTILIFDEVMCGFRTALHGAQAYYGITPDMTCLGKIIGSGLWRQSLSHGLRLPGRPHLSGRDSFGQPSGHDGRHRNTAYHHRRPVLYGPGDGPYDSPYRRAAPESGRSRRTGLRSPVGIYVQPVLYGQRREEFRRFVRG